MLYKNIKDLFRSGKARWGTLAKTSNEECNLILKVSKDESKTNIVLFKLLNVLFEFLFNGNRKVWMLERVM